MGEIDSIHKDCLLPKGPYNKQYQRQTALLFLVRLQLFIYLSLFQIFIKTGLM